MHFKPPIAAAVVTKDLQRTPEPERRVEERQRDLDWHVTCRYQVEVCKAQLHGNVLQGPEEEGEALVARAPGRPAAWDPLSKIEGGGVAFS